jgi:hypothetical protein
MREPATFCAPHDEGNSVTIEQQLLGTWRLVSLRRELVATGQAIADPPRHGLITFAPGGRMMTMLVWTDRPMPAGDVPTDEERAALHRSLIAFAGHFVVDRDRLVFHVEISWNELWTGHEQVRSFVLDGGRLTLRTEPHKSALDGRDSVYIQVWEKLA